SQEVAFPIVQSSIGFSRGFTCDFTRGARHAPVLPRRGRVQERARRGPGDRSNRAVRAIVVHGGAGRESRDSRAPRRAGVARAVEAGWRVLAQRGGELVTEAARRHWSAPQGGLEGTVGAVACDGRGHVAAATSTGGLSGKRRGRVGDSAVIGAGTYADDLLGAGSATGPGEAIIRTSLVHAALAWVRRGLDPAWVAQYALAE